MRVGVGERYEVGYLPTTRNKREEEEREEDVSHSLTHAERLAEEPDRGFIKMPVMRRKKCPKNGIDHLKVAKEIGLNLKRCQACGTVAEYGSLDIDHVNGIHGDNRPENLQILCRKCHRQKHHYADGIPFDWEVEGIIDERKYELEGVVIED